MALANVTAEVFELHRLSWASLFLAMPSLAARVLADGRLHSFSSLVVAALVFSWLGDWVGDLGSGVLVKLVLFQAAHICYVAAFWPFRSGGILTRRPWSLICTLAVGAWLAMAAGPMSTALLVYGCSVGLMSALATGVHLLTAVGAVSFLVSDFLIALTTRFPTRTAGSI